MIKQICVPLLALLLSVANAQAQETVKTKYGLFHPVPKTEMREMSTDRPDVTESAYTVDAGHFQLETDLIKWVKNDQGGIRSVDRFYNLANLKLGLTNSTDFQVVINTYHENSINQTFASGAFFEDITLRLKQNLWGNKGGKTALTAMPYLTIPLKEGGLEGGIIFPFVAEINSKINMGAQAQFALARNDVNDKYHAEILNSITFSRELAKNLEGFVETFYNYSFENKNLEAYADAGLIISISDNVKLDAGTNLGLNKASSNVYFVGLSFRY